MTVGLCLISHDNIGKALLETATSMLGSCPLPTELVGVTPSSDPDQVLQRARMAVQGVDRGDGVIVLTDMFGSTPSNIATALAGDNDHIVVIAGLNLPMLVRLMNYPRLGIAQLTEKALSGGREGIFSCGPEGDV